MLSRITGEYLNSFWRNTVSHAGKRLREVLLLKPFEAVPDEKVLFDFSRGQSELALWGTGCDQDIGGYSTAKTSLLAGKYLRFNGNISLALQPGSEAMYSGYAAMRSHPKLPAHLFDGRSYDCSRWAYLLIRARGDHRAYSVNFKTSRSFAGDLYVCRVKFTNPYEWEDVVLPFEYFIRTNCGAEYLRQNAPNMESISSFGVLLADNLPGPFNLDVESIKTVTFEGLPADIQADPSRQLTRNIYDPKKKRIDWQQDKNFGFGFDMGSGMIETADKYYGRNRGNGGSQFTLNSSWVLQPVENSNQKLKR